MRSGRIVLRAWLAAFLVVSSAASALGSDAELDELKSAVREMQKTIQKLNQKIERLEKERQVEARPAKAARPPAPVIAEAPVPASPETMPSAVLPPPEPVAPVAATSPPSGADVSPLAVAPALPSPSSAGEAAAGYAENVISSQGIGPQAPIDPQYRGFFRVPYTQSIIRFNAKPRVDFTYDNNNTGDDSRFVTAKIPVNGDPNQGGGPVFNANGKGSQLIIDWRAPLTAGSPRFYYQNDFFGSGSGEFNLRVQQLFGKIYGLTIGQTFSPFEDPDVWPDTVDYEGPNSMIFARFPSMRYQLDLTDWLALNPGIAQPSTEVSDFDQDGVVENVSGADHAPDFAMNLRAESDDVGHLQLGTVFRYLGARSNTFGDQEVFGWGLNLSGGLDVPVPWSETDTDLLLAQGTWGEGIGRYGNDSGFFPTDAAFNARGSLQPLPYYAAFVGYTHRWLPDWRSTATYGWVKVNGLSTQGPDAYSQTQYASVNLIWQLRERLSVGVEALYGDNQKESGATGNAFRTQVGVAYSLF